jgi:MGT family glycosyltransferase
MRHRFAGPSCPRPTARRSRCPSCGCERSVGSRPIATVVFFPEGAFGPTNNCVGIGAVLRARGHRVVFVIEESFAGTLAAQGFEERLMRLGPAPAEPEAPGQFWKDFVRDTAPVFRGTTTEQLDGFVIPTWQALLDGARYVDERLGEIFAEVDPAVIVEDNVCAFPAIAASGRPWVRIVSCNPLEVEDPALPPAFSGLALEDRDGAAAFRERYAARAGDLQAGFSEFCVARGAPPLPGLAMIHESPWLNLLLYPGELDYPRSRPLGPTWHNLETSVRATDAPWEPPADDGRRLVYLSLGSLGSADVELMRALVAALADSPHRYIVSRGPRHDEYALADNMIGAEFLPQTSVLPHVDAIITHGGNNTVTEAMWFGKPMLVLPIFWDQHDNAQRVHETGYGIRLPTYGFEPAALRDAVDALLGDEVLRARCRTASERLRGRPGTVTAADLIERVAAG